MAKARDYKFEYLRDQSSPADIKDRANRNKARAETEKKLGHKLSTKQEVDHIQPISKGGAPLASENLRVVDRHTNRVKGKK